MGRKLDWRSRPDAGLLFCPAPDMKHAPFFDRIMQGHDIPGVYSPSAFLSKHLPPTLIVEGDRDTLVLPQDAVAFRDREVRLGANCQLVMYPVVGHLLTRNLAVQDKNFHPDPNDTAEAAAREHSFLKGLGFEGAYDPVWN